MLGFVKALEKSLHYPSYGLGESNARIRLADFYMQRGDFKAAEPYATEAAESYSWFGLTCALDCYTGLCAWDAAEQMVQRVAQRYPETSAAVWYAWCRRTGRVTSPPRRSLQTPTTRLTVIRS